MSASALTAASSFNALPLSLAAAAAAAAFCLLFLACAAAAICRSRTVDASERESSVTVFLAGGIAVSCLWMSVSVSCSQSQRIFRLYDQIAMHAACPSGLVGGMRSRQEQCRSCVIALGRSRGRRVSQAKFPDDANRKQALFQGSGTCVGEGAAVSAPVHVE